MEALRALLERAAESGVVVVGQPGAEGSFYPDERAIVINTALSPRVVVHCLLHELGHVESDRDCEGHELARSRDDVLSVIDEEIEAWHLGWTIAERMELLLDRRAFDRTRRRALVGYVEWAHGWFSARSRRG